MACTVNQVIGTDEVCNPDAVEACDGLDNDCDGLIDEDVPGTGIACPTGLGNNCEAGLTGCTAATFSCEPVSPSPEVCDGIDNDCDGVVDDDGSWRDFNAGLDGGNATHAPRERPRHPPAHRVSERRAERARDHDGRRAVPERG